MDVVEAIREKRVRLEALKAQVETLELELREISAIAEGKDERSARLPFGRGKRKRRSNGMQPGSTTEKAFQVLDASDRALSVEEIISRIRELHGEEIEKPTLVSNLSRYVQRKDTFTRIAPNTYGLRKHALRDTQLGAPSD